MLYFHHSHLISNEKNVGKSFTLTQQHWLNWFSIFSWKIDNAPNVSTTNPFYTHSFRHRLKQMQRICQLFGLKRGNIHSRSTPTDGINAAIFFVSNLESTDQRSISCNLVFATYTILHFRNSLFQEMEPTRFWH